ncbi:MAG: MarR family winged helix-turn-helix transcriptional regulator [Hyphomicrobiales bacterium]
MSKAIALRSPAPRGGGGFAYRLDGQVGFVLRQVSQRHAGLFAAMIGDETTPTQWAVLAKLMEAGASSQNALGRQTAMDAATVKGVVERLLRRGLVETRSDRQDARRIVVDLTEAGRRAAETYEARAVAITEETLKPLAAPERKVFLALLKRLC